MRTWKEAKTKWDITLKSLVLDHEHYIFVYQCKFPQMKFMLYNGKLSGEKSFRKFRGFAVICKSFICEIWGGGGVVSFTPTSILIGNETWPKIEWLLDNGPFNKEGIALVDSSVVFQCCFSFNG